MSENAAESSNQERRVGPSVSRDKWAQHAKQKMARGYVLIVAADKRRANFWMREKGYEMCAYDIARALVASGDVVPTGEHHLGTIYELAAMPAPTPAKKSKAAKAKPVAPPVAEVEEEPIDLPVVDADAEDLDDDADDADDDLDADDEGDGADSDDDEDDTDDDV